VHFHLTLNAFYSGKNVSANHQVLGLELLRYTRVALIELIVSEECKNMSEHKNQPLVCFSLPWAVSKAHHTFDNVEVISMNILALTTVVFL